jgi:hypothetical protein
MRHLPVFALAVFCTSGFAGVPVVEVDAANGRAETIRNLEINGTLYNASFDQNFGAHLFVGDTAGANAAVDAIVAVLNPDTYNVDNGHPLQVPVFWVLDSVEPVSGISACRSVYVPACSNNEWANVGEWSGTIGEGGSVLFELVPVQVAIDVIPGDPANKVYPNKSGQLPVAVLSAADFDAAQVDPATLRFGSAEAAVAGAPVITNVDGEFGPDTTVKFKVQEAGIFCNDNAVDLSGETYAGEPFTGTDSIDASECETGGCHPY